MNLDFEEYKMKSNTEVSMNYKHMESKVIQRKSNNIPVINRGDT